MTLKSKLDTLKADFEADKPPYNVLHSVIEVMHRALAEQHDFGPGDKAPVLMLFDPDGVEVTTSIVRQWLFNRHTDWTVEVSHYA